LLELNANRQLNSNDLVAEVRKFIDKIYPSQAIS